MSVMRSDGKLLIPGGNGAWWSPFGDTDAEIAANMKTGYMPNALGAMRVGPRHVTGSAEGDDKLHDFLGGIGALDGQAKAAYDAKQKAKKNTP